MATVPITLECNFLYILVNIGKEQLEMSLLNGLGASLHAILLYSTKHLPPSLCFKLREEGNIGLLITQVPKVLFISFVSK